MKSDWKYFNCSEEYEFDYISSQYVESKKVKEFLKQLCVDGQLSNSTHDEVYDLLKVWDYKRND